MTKKNIILIASIILLIFTAWTYDRLYRHKTRILATIDKINWFHIGKGYYKQRVYYRYDYKGQNFESSFKSGKIKGKMRENSKIIIEIDTIRPEMSKYIGKPRTRNNELIDFYDEIYD
ncbi:MAG: hypothetical protein RBS81_10975 [Tenuifilaceae bacterium]|jgi:hypothetical protein|nr:hypothetical protein [Tenuifilaceae bacterium]